MGSEGGMHLRAMVQRMVGPALWQGRLMVGPGRLTVLFQGQQRAPSLGRPMAVLGLALGRYCKS